LLVQYSRACARWRATLSRIAHFIGFVSPEQTIGPALICKEKKIEIKQQGCSLVLLLGELIPNTQPGAQATVMVTKTRANLLRCKICNSRKITVCNQE
jgi:hypothetical protein